MTKETRTEENVNVAATKEQLESTTAELEHEIAKLRDPTVHASIMYAVMRERESANMIMKNLLTKIDRLEETLTRLVQQPRQAAPAAVEAAQARPSIDMLADVDRTIISHIKEKGSATAEDIQRMLRYRGKNAACARLSRLAELGFLNRQRAGRITRYTCAQP